jgi:hypothetical protein
LISQELNIKSRITEGFIERFQLKPDELNALRTTRDGFLHPVKKTNLLNSLIKIRYLRNFLMFSNVLNRFIKIVNYYYVQINKQSDWKLWNKWHCIKNQPMRDYIDGYKVKDHPLL